jgi:hypothetical protein
MSVVMCLSTDHLSVKTVAWDSSRTVILLATRRMPALTETRDLVRSTRGLRGVELVAWSGSSCDAAELFSGQL